MRYSVCTHLVVEMGLRCLRSRVVAVQCTLGVALPLSSMLVTPLHSELLRASPYVTALHMSRCPALLCILETAVLNVLHVIVNSVLAAGGCGSTRGVTPSRALTLMVLCFNCTLG